MKQDLRLQFSEACIDTALPVSLDMYCVYIFDKKPLYLLFSLQNNCLVALDFYKFERS